jgi:hypothetical protein
VTEEQAREQAQTIMRAVVLLAVKAEADEFEAAVREDEIGSDEFWEKVERRVENTTQSLLRKAGATS